LRKLAKAAILAAAAVAFIAAYGSLTGIKELKPDAATNVKVGQQFAIKLDEAQSIPYRWQAAISDESLVRLVSSEVGHPAFFSIQRMLDGKSGAPGEYRVFCYEALKAGECTIVMNHADIRDGDFFITSTFKVLIEE
jgi:predicted secreted protein